MIVKFIAKHNQHEGWLVKNKLYIVLGISFNQNDSYPQITIKTEDSDTPAIFSLVDFDIIDAKIDTNWVFIIHTNTNYSIRPIEFSGDFWDKFHDADPNAEKVFWQVYNELAKQLDSYKNGLEQM